MRKILVPCKNFVINGPCKSMLNLMLKYFGIIFYKILSIIVFHFIANIQIFLHINRKFTFSNLKKVVKEIHREFVLSPVDKTANMMKLYCIQTLKQELITAYTYKHALLDERYAVDRPWCHITAPT